MIPSHPPPPQGSEADNPQVNRRNVAQRAEALVRDVLRRASFFRTPNLLLLFGDDFRFVNADKMYLNMDLLMAEINRHSNATGLSLRYALAEDYFRVVRPQTGRSLAESAPTVEKAVSDDPLAESAPAPVSAGFGQRLAQEWPRLDGASDLFPYRKDVAWQWYTGYYTTRPQQKFEIVSLLATVRAAAMLVAGLRGSADEETKGASFSSVVCCV